MQQEPTDVKVQEQALEQLVSRVGSCFTLRFGQDGIGVLGPDERFAALIPAVDEAADGIDEFADGVEAAPDPTHASEIEVRFHADGPAQTTVEVEHRYFERLIGGEGIHGAIRSGGGWPALLDSFARMVKDQTSGDTGTDPA